jgi:tyrosine-protein kinase Etk/Wzc
MLVSDSLPLLKLADLVIYTLRADYTEIKIVSYVNSLVKDKKVNNIGVVFNSVKSITKSYYKYGYGYRYSYQNKSNYGYGYGYDQEKS